MNCQVYYTNYLAYNTFKEIKKALVSTIISFAIL